MLWWIFEWERSGGVLVGITLTAQLESRECPFYEGAIIIPQNGYGGYSVMDLELEDIVLFALKLRNLYKSGWILIVAHVVLTRTDLEHDY